MVSRIFRIGQHRPARRQDHRGRRRHVLELVGDDVDVGGEQFQRLDIGIFRAGRVQHDIEGRQIRIGRKHLAAQAKPCRRHRQHPAQLSAAENSDGVAGLQLHLMLTPSRRFLRAFADCFGLLLAPGLSRPDSAGSFSASTLAASSAALMAPGLPIASVPTGIPAGICTME